MFVYESLLLRHLNVWECKYIIYNNNSLPLYFMGHVLSTNLFMKGKVFVFWGKEHTSIKDYVSI